MKIQNIFFTVAPVFAARRVMFKDGKSGGRYFHPLYMWPQRAKATRWVCLDESTKRHTFASRLNNIYRLIFKSNKLKDSWFQQLSFKVCITFENPHINVWHTVDSSRHTHIGAFARCGHICVSHVLCVIRRLSVTDDWWHILRYRWLKGDYL